MWTQWKEFQQSANVRCSYLQGALLSQRWRGWLTALPLSLWVKLLLFIADPLAILDLSFRVVVLSFRLLLSLLFLTQFFADDVQPPLLAVRHVLLLLLPPLIVKPSLLQLQAPLLHQQEALSDPLCSCGSFTGTPKELFAPEKRKSFSVRTQDLCPTWKYALDDNTKIMIYRLEI